MKNNDGSGNILHMYYVANPDFPSRGTYPIKKTLTLINYGTRNTFDNGDFAYGEAHCTEALSNDEISKYWMSYKGTRKVGEMFKEEK